MINRLDRYWSRVTEDQHSYEVRMMSDTNREISEWVAGLKEEQITLLSELNQASDQEYLGVRNSIIMKLFLGFLLVAAWLFAAAFSMEGEQSFLFYGGIYLAFSLIEFIEHSCIRTGRLTGAVATLSIIFCFTQLVADGEDSVRFYWVSIAFGFLSFFAIERYCAALWLRARTRVAKVEAHQIVKILLGALRECLSTTPLMPCSTFQTTKAVVRDISGFSSLELLR